MNTLPQTETNKSTQQEPRSEREQRIHKAKYHLNNHDKGILLSIDLPGVRLEDISLKSVKNRLSLQAPRHQLPPQGSKLINLNEVATDYELELGVHRDYELAAAIASYSNGVLSLQIPRSKESAPRDIAIGS